jgi:hypothetical protein
MEIEEKSKNKLFLTVHNKTPTTKRGQKTLLSQQRQRKYHVENKRETSN